MDSPRHAGHHGGARFPIRSPELRRFSCPWRSNTGETPIEGYRRCADARLGSGEALAHQEHAGVIGEARESQVRRNLVLPVSEKTMASASISGTSARFLPWAELVEGGRHAGVLRLARGGLVRRR